LVDTQERETKVLARLMEDNKVDISFKSGGSADYVIIDLNDVQWGVERKSFLDCYSSIITKDVGSKAHRIYGQLAQLLNDYNGRAIFLLETPKYFPKKVGNPYIIMQSVYTFFSERSLIMPCMITQDENHTAYLLLKLAQNIHEMEFRGRGFKVMLDASKS
jgi:ERCC4-type nuclease